MYGLDITIPKKVDYLLCLHLGFFWVNSSDSLGLAVFDILDDVLVIDRYIIALNNVVKRLLNDDMLREIVKVKVFMLNNKKSMDFLRLGLMCFVIIYSLVFDRSKTTFDLIFLYYGLYNIIMLVFHIDRTHDYHFF